MAAAPVFAATPKGTQVRIDTANANRDGTGALGTCYTAAGAGILRRSRICGVGTVTAGIVRFYVSYDGGTTKRLIHEELVIATTASATVAGYEKTIEWYDLLVPSNQFLLYASTEKTELFNIFTDALEN